MAKLKPYLALKKKIITTEELEEMHNKEITQQNYKMMSELTILENRKLCQIVDEKQEIDESIMIQRQEKEMEGWIFELFFRIGNGKEDITKKSFVCGYAVMTEHV